MKKFIFIIAIFISNIVFADAIVLPQKISYPVSRVDTTTNVTISESGRVDYSIRISNGDKWWGYHVLTTILLKDSKGNILHKIETKKGINAGYFKTEVVISKGISQIAPQLASKVDSKTSVIKNERVGGKLPSLREFNDALDIFKKNIF